MWRNLSTSIHMRNVETTQFCHNLRCSGAKLVLLQFTLFCRELRTFAWKNMNQQLCLWRKGDKYEVCCLQVLFLVCFCGIFEFELSVYFHCISQSNLLSICLTNSTIAYFLFLSSLHCIFFISLCLFCVFYCSGIYKILAVYYTLCNTCIYIFCCICALIAIYFCFQVISQAKSPCHLFFV